MAFGVLMTNYYNYQYFNKTSSFPKSIIMLLLFRKLKKVIAIKIQKKDSRYQTEYR